MRCWLLLLVLTLFSARSGRFVLTQPEDFQAGKFTAAALSSQGKIIPGKAVKEINVDAAVVWSLLELGPDHVLLGTGNSPRLLAYTGGKLEQIFQDPEKGRLAITDIVRDDAGTVYFSVIPKPVIYKMQGREIKKLAELDATYIFTLKPVGNGRLLAGGGPKACVFLVKPEGKAEKIVSLEAEQVMDIVDAGNGEYLAGTSRPGLLVSFKLDGSYRVVQAFQQEEVAAVRLLPDKSILVALNQGGGQPQPEMPISPEGIQLGQPAQISDKEQQQPAMGAMDEEMAQMQQGQAGPPAGRAMVLQMFQDKGMKQIFELKQGTLLSMDGDEKNGFWLGTDDQGRVYQLFPSREETLLSLDLRSGKVVSLAGSGGEVHWLGTGQPAKLVKIEKIGSQSSYQSQVLDSQFPAEWGKLFWQGRGAVKFETRSGNVREPDGSWSNWQETGPGNPGKVNSPRSRYIQFRAGLGNDAEINRVELSYRNLNQAHYITQLNLGSVSGQRKQVSDQAQVQGKNSKPLESAYKRVQINWRVENPDQDRLFSRLFFKKDGDSLWTLLADDDELKTNSYTWDASGLPDGIYRLKLSVSDAPDNSDAESFSVEKISDLLVIDTRPPELECKVSEQGVVSGQARDETSEIASLQYVLDEQKPRPVISRDGILDEKVEAFEFTLPKLEKGSHKIFLQACDQADNCRSISLEFSSK
jgi:hypothetical protein